MQRKILFSIILTIIVIVAASVAVSALLISEYSGDTNPAIQGIPKAAIIDQLNTDIPNESFHNQTIEYFQASGYEVDVFTTNDITVNFYKNLPKMNYNFIVIRTFGVSEKSNESISLFTGEKYQEDKYVSEQLFGQVKKASPTGELIGSKTTDNSTVWFTLNNTGFLGTPLSLKEYFVITPKFVKDSMIGKFPETVFILAGSSTLENDSMAKSLIDRGATTVIGWDDKVTNSEGDKMILELLEKVLIDNVKVRQAVDMIGDELNSQDRYYNGTLKYYPLN